MNQIVSLSGGKDSTAMLHMMIERGEEIEAVLFFDSGWEFPGMLEHIRQIEANTGIEIVRLNPSPTFDYWMNERRIVARKGPMKGMVHRIGNGWPSPLRRWCTRQKVDALDKFEKRYKNPVSCIGLASDENQRIPKNKKDNIRYPLIEWGVSESDTMIYCRKLGYTWNGLYDRFRRVSCFCCPLQRIGDLRTLRRYYPDLWWRMLWMDAAIPENRGFRDYDTVHDLDSRFEYEDELLAAGVDRKRAERLSCKWRQNL